MFDPLLALGLGVGAEGAAALVVKGLAVGGGFLVGYFLGAVIAWALDRWVFAQKAPLQLKKAVALVMGIAVAVLLAMILFGEGGNGMFGRGGEGQQKGSTPDEGKKTLNLPKEEKKPETPQPKIPPKPTPGDIHITILGGSEVTPDRKDEGRFFLVEGDPDPKSLPQLKDAVAGRQQANPKAEPVLIFRFKGAVLSPSHPEIKRLTAWLQEAKILNRFE